MPSKFNTVEGALWRAPIPGVISLGYHAAVDGMHMSAAKHAGVQVVSSAVGQSAAQYIDAPAAYSASEVDKELFHNLVGSLLTGVVYAAGEWAAGSKSHVRDLLTGAIIDAVSAPVWIQIHNMAFLTDAERKAMKAAECAQLESAPAVE